MKPRLLVKFARKARFSFSRRNKENKYQMLEYVGYMDGERFERQRSGISIHAMTSGPVIHFG